ncbi:MAG: response regulator [Spirochaetota bacterium]
MSEARIVLIEDEKSIRNFLRATLEAQKYKLIEASNGREGISLTASHVPELVILDLGLPDMDGIEVIEAIRAWASIPILILSARDQELDKVAALDAGADDYLTKPFGLEELLARIRVALRHTSRAPGSEDSPSGTFTAGALEIDFERRTVTISGERIHLTPTEYKLLSILAGYAGRVLTHSFLLKAVWGPGSVSETQYLRVFMANLRRKLEKDPTNPRYVLTEMGVGYRLSDE